MRWVGQSFVSGETMSDLFRRCWTPPGGKAQGALDGAPRQADGPRNQQQDARVLSVVETKQLISIKPDNRFPMIDRGHFHCGCGQEFDETVLRYWLGILED